MVLIPVPDGAPYCIDERLTAYGDYAEFLAAKGQDYSGQPPECESNKDYEPVMWVEETAFGDPTRTFCGPSMADANPDHAVRCIDFCDAFAYCSWAGKRLCGLRGSAGNEIFKFQATTIQESNDFFFGRVLTVENESYNVCTQGGTTEYPYGDAERPGACLDDARVEAMGEDANAVRDTAGNECRGSQPPFDQVYDTVGSLGYWLNICSPSGLHCFVHGGVKRDDYQCRCLTTRIAYDSGVFQAGVRCCADAVRSSHVVSNGVVNND